MIVPSITHRPWYRLAHSSFVLVLARLIGAVLTFGISVIVGRGLGETGFGQWTLSMAWASTLSMLSDFSLNTLLTREAAKTRGQANALLLGSLLGKLPFLLVIGGFVTLTAPWLGESVEVARALRVVIFLAGASLAYGSFTALFRAFDWMTPVLWLDTGGLLAQLGGTVWLVRAGAGSFELVVLVVAVQAAQLVFAFVIWWIGVRPRGGPLAASRGLVKQMLIQSVPFALGGAIGVVLIRSNTLLLGYLRDEAEVGLFGAAWRFSESAKLIPSGMFAAAFPAFSASAANAARESDEPLFPLFTRVLFVLSVLAAIGLALFARPILALTYGPNFLPAAPALVWLALGLVPSLMISGFELYLYATGDERYVVRLDALSALVQVIASVPLIITFGAMGAAIGMLLGKLVIWLPLWRRITSVRTQRLSLSPQGRPHPSQRGGAGEQG